MTTKTDPRTWTQEQCDLALAGAMTKCPHCSGKGGYFEQQFNSTTVNNITCEPCNDTGEVPLLELRKPCPWLNSMAGHQDPEEKECKRCDGRRWVPNVTLETLLPAMEQAGWLPANIGRSRDDWYWRWERSDDPLTEGDAEGATVRLAASQAACVALAADGVKLEMSNGQG